MNKYESFLFLKKEYRVFQFVVFVLWVIAWGLLVVLAIAEPMSVALGMFMTVFNISFLFLMRLLKQEYRHKLVCAGFKL